jgi:AbrB family looped-hinge helix DNA binding protein
MPTPMPEFYGSATVGERGQIVLPAIARKELGIKPKDKILVMGMPPHMPGVMLIKFEAIGAMVEQMDKGLKELSKRMEILSKAQKKK